MRLKVIGYIVAGVGLLGIFLSTKNIMSSIPILKNIPIQFILLPSMAIVAISIILMLSEKSAGKEKSIKEVPIYHKDKIVGYRRHY